LSHRIFTELTEFSKLTEWGGRGALNRINMIMRILKVAGAGPCAVADRVARTTRSPGLRSEQEARGRPQNLLTHVSLFDAQPITFEHVDHCNDARKYT
jgi:hypothetical protein